ncbi:MAG: M15 family metallopeptidase [Ruminococcus sp.]|nr:M15 family metallopeptidase [Ruminococcus sp.]
MNEEKGNKTVIRRKYRIRLACTSFVLVAAIMGTAMMLTDHSSGKEVTAGTTVSSSAADNSSQTEKKQSVTTADSSTPPQQTAQGTQLSAKAAAKSEETPAKPQIEVKDGVTYVGGILIANKTYALPAGYEPGLSQDAQNAFNKMQQAAAAEGISLWICSGYRSYSYQQQLYDNYVAQDGKAEADRYSARPGHSEHQTGLAIDVNDAGSSFDNTPEAAWLAAHCADYGFIVRYKPGKESSTGYMAESWHIRYLGDAELCRKINASGLSLEEYLGITSVYSD